MVGDFATHGDQESTRPTLCIESSPESGVVTLIQDEGTGDQQFEPGKLFFHADRVMHWLQGELITPVTLELDLTLACNDRCPYCPHLFAHGSRHLQLDSIRRVLDEAAQLGIPGLTVTGGGEPLMHPKFSEVLGVIRDYPFSAGIITNGGLLTEEIASQMASTFDWIRVSLDAVSEARFRQVRGHGGVEARVQRLALLPKARKAIVRKQCELGVSFLTYSETREEILPAARLVRQLGFDYLQVKPMVDWSSQNKHGSLLRNQDGVISAIDVALNVQDAHFDVFVSRHRYEPEILGHSRYYSAFHCAWFVLAVGPSVSGVQSNPTLYLDCSSKYLPAWTIGEFSNMREILRSRERKDKIAKASSTTYCIPSEKHAIYNTLLEKMSQRSRIRSLTLQDIEACSPKNITHPYSI
jgi:organic radical activating enzyme